jgi:hypothetical protein
MLKQIGTLALALAAGSLSMAAAIPAAADGNSASATYVTPGADASGSVTCQGPQSVGTQGSGLPSPVPNVIQPVPATSPVGVGGDCFQTKGTSMMSIKIADTSGMTIPALFYFQDANGVQIGTTATYFCGSIDNTPVPDGSDHVIISVGVTALDPVSTITTKAPVMPCPAPAAVTTGTITVTGDGGLAGYTSPSPLTPAAAPVAAPAAQIAPATAASSVANPVATGVTATAAARTIRAHGVREL